MSDRSAKLLECATCFERYSREEIETGLYQLKTMVCSKCYARAQKLPHERSCFGKPTVNLPSGKKLLGYNPLTEACSRLCPDREICARVVRGAR